MAVGTLLTAVLIAAGRAQREGADTTCPSCSPSWDLAPGGIAGSAPAHLQNP